MRIFLKYALLGSAAIAAAVASLVFVFYLLKHSLIQENEALVHSVAHTILPALLVNDSAQVSSVMKSLETYPSIQTAELISSEGASLASFARDGYSLDPSVQGFELASVTDPVNQLHVMAPLTFDSLIVANLHVVVNLWPIYLRLMIWAGIFLIVPSALYVLVRHFKIKIRLERASSDAGPGGGSSYSLDRAMHEALSDAQISLEYQPIQRMSDGGVFGMEVVVCWRHSSGETHHVSPADFVTLAEKSGLVIPFDAWVIETACRQAAEWQRQYGPLILALNLSSSQFKDPTFVQRIRAICESAQYPYQLLECEINESVLHRDLQRCVTDIDAFVSQGLSLTVDGFGLTQTSMTLLESKALQKVKLDRRLVSNASRDADIAQLLQMTVSKANENDIQVMADGVESESHWVQLQGMGCILGQGKHFSPPLTLQQFSAFLAKQQFRPSRGRVVSSSDAGLLSGNSSYAA
jgi:EAL domain-containing protein (putative c-di-GMP-specific phosphodiesterase class I)